MKKSNITEFLRIQLPTIFIATQLDKLTDNIIKWQTIQNERSKANKGTGIPEGIFVYRGKRKIFINRDPFLAWWSRNIK